MKKLGLLLMSLAFIYGLLAGQIISSPIVKYKYITVTLPSQPVFYPSGSPNNMPPKYLEVIKEVIKEVPVEVIKEVEITKWRNIHPRNFESVEHFKKWYAENEPPIVFFGKAEFNKPVPNDPRWDCDDYAEWLQRTALEQGYSISIALIWGGVYYQTTVSEIKGAHAGNLVEINGVYYFVEPQPGKFEMKRVVSRD